MNAQHRLEQARYQQRDRSLQGEHGQGRQQYSSSKEGHEPHTGQAVHHRFDCQGIKIFGPRQPLLRGSQNAQGRGAEQCSAYFEALAEPLSIVGRGGTDPVPRALSQTVGHPLEVQSASGQSAQTQGQDDDGELLENLEK